MEGGSRLEKGNKGHKKKSDNFGSVLEPNIEPFVAHQGHDPRELRSWAKRTGFVSTAFSGEAGRTEIGRTNANDGLGGRFGLEKGVLEKNDSISPKIEIDPILGRTRRPGSEIDPVTVNRNGRVGENGVLGFRDGGLSENEMRRNGAEEIDFGARNVERRDEINENGARYGNNNEGANVVEEKKDDGDLRREVGVDMYPGGEDSGDGGGWHSSPGMVCGLTDRPGYGKASPLPFLYFY